MNKIFSVSVLGIAALNALESSENLSLDSNISTKTLPKQTAQIVFTKDDNPAQAILKKQTHPLYSGDMAKSFLNIPGFSMTRKGGGGNELYFRSLGASRLPIFVDGGELHGACGGRMDTSITYLSPENYDKILILKGPQDVRYGSLISGGVLIEREITRLDSTTFNAQAGFLGGNFGRGEASFAAIAGGKKGSIQALASHYSQNDYYAGGGTKVHSAYKRESASAVATYTPNEKTAFEVSADLGRGNASYADRMMDGRTFDRMSFNARYNQFFDSEKRYEFDWRAYVNDVDHIMDNFSFRDSFSADGKKTYSLSNPRRTNSGTRLEFTLNPNENLKFFIGANYNNDFHRVRLSGVQASSNAANAVLNQSYKPNFLINSFGTFFQGQYSSFNNGVFFGARYDFANLVKLADNSFSNYNLGSAFIRYEHYFSNLNFYAGLGFAQRRPDFWEATKVNGMKLNAESNLQYDMGLNYKNSIVSFNANVFGSYIFDYILLKYTNNAISDTLNVNALLVGGEAFLKVNLYKEFLSLFGHLSYTYGENLSLKIPLAQMLPLYGKVGIEGKINGFSASLNATIYAPQNRVATGYGSVIGQDLGKTSSFSTFDLYAGYEFTKIALLLGVENLADTKYYYPLSKTGGMVDGYANIGRVYEPGRSFWLKIRFGV